MSDGVQEVKRDGEYYHVKGRVGNRSVDVHVPAHEADRLSVKQGRELFERSIRRVAEAA